MWQQPAPYLMGTQNFTHALSVISTQQEALRKHDSLERHCLAKYLEDPTEARRRRENSHHVLRVAAYRPCERIVTMSEVRGGMFHVQHHHRRRDERRHRSQFAAARRGPC